MPKETKSNLSESLKKLEQISDWFDEQKEIDLEKGLLKVKEGAKLIKESRAQLKDIENEFGEIKAEMEGE